MEELNKAEVAIEQFLETLDDNQINALLLDLEKAPPKPAIPINIPVPAAAEQKVIEVQDSTKVEKLPDNKRKVKRSYIVEPMSGNRTKIVQDSGRSFVIEPLPGNRMKIVERVLEDDN